MSAADEATKHFGTFDPTDLPPTGEAPKTEPVPPIAEPEKK